MINSNINSSDLFNGTQDVLVPRTDDQSEEASLQTLKQKFTKEDGSIDVDGLVKAKYHADIHIPKIESENAALRQRALEGKTFQDVLDQINVHRAASNGQITPDNERANDQVRQPTEIDLEQTIDKIVSKRQQEAVQLSNTKHVASELQKVWGRDFENKLLQVGATMGLNRNTLQFMIQNSPQALLTLVLRKNEDVTNVTPPLSRMNSGSNSAAVKNLAYYHNILKTDRKKFESIEIQKEMHDEAEKQGRDFYK